MPLVEPVTSDTLPASDRAAGEAWVFNWMFITEPFAVTPEPSQAYLVV